MSGARGNVITLIIITTVILLLASYTWSLKDKNQAVELQTSPAGLSLGGTTTTALYTNLEGEPISLSDFVGEVLVVNSWASWCPACGNQLKDLTTLSQNYEDKGVRVIAINRAEPADTAYNFLKYINASEDILLVLDPDDRYFKSIDGYAMPETLFYDRTGNVVHHSQKQLTLSEMTMYVDEALFSTKSESSE